VCGNGIVEEGEACDDGNRIDTDDCRSDCSGALCCFFDPQAGERCDDHDPCTQDALDPVAGCTHAENGTCCTSDDACEGTCRRCVGCSLFPWDCCDSEAGSTCLSLSPECRGTRCFGAASCECAGGLACADGAVPAAIVRRFTGACDQVRLQESLAPDVTQPARARLRIGRTRSKSARKLLAQARRLARSLAARGEVTRACAKSVRRKMLTVRRAIPLSRRLRRCLTSGTGG
jgi:cysteine-rich repeat protein